MVTVEDCILGNSALHDRFFATTEILARLVSSTPRAVGMALRAPRLEDEYNFAVSGCEASFSPAQFPA